MGRAARQGGSGGQIEFIPPRDAIFGGESAADFAGVDGDDQPDPDDVAPRSRWLPAAATLAVMALVGGGILAAAPWDAGTDTASLPDLPPASTAASTVAIEGEDAGSFEPVTGFVFDPLPPGFAVRGAWSETDPDRSNEPPMGWGEVWATDDASRTGGSWFSLTLLPYRYSEASVPGTRVDLGGRIGLVRDEGDGVLRLVVPVSQSFEPQTMLVRSFGRTFDELVELVGSIGVEQDHPQMVDDRPVYLDPTQLAGLELAASGPTQEDLLDAYLTGATETNTYYESGNGDTYISIDASPRDDTLEPLGRLAVGPVRIFPDSSSVSSEFTGDDLVLGVSPSGSDPNIVARWHTDDTTITVQTTMPLGDLLALLPTVRRTTANEWLVVQRRVDEAMADEVPADEAPVQSTGPGLSIGRGTVSDGTPWEVALHPPDSLQIRFGNETISAPEYAIDDGIAVATFDGGTVATALSASGLGGTTLRARIGAQIVADVPLIDIGQLDPTSSFAGVVGALVFAQTGPYTIEVLDGAATVIDRYTSPGFRS